MSMVFKDLPTDKKNEIVIGSLAVQFTYPDGKPLRDAEYTLTFTNGETRTGKLDGEGKLLVENTPAGAKASVKLKDVPVLALAQ